LLHFALQSRTGQFLRLKFRLRIFQIHLSRGYSLLLTAHLLFQLLQNHSQSLQFNADRNGLFNALRHHRGGDPDVFGQFRGSDSGKSESAENGNDTCGNLPEPEHVKTPVIKSVEPGNETVVNVTVRRLQLAAPDFRMLSTSSSN
jgi:hypothetical protein